MKHYRRSHIKNKIHKIRPRHSIFLKLWFWLVLLLFILLGVVFYVFLFYSGLQIKNIYISGNENIDNAKIMGVTVPATETKIFDVPYSGQKINQSSSDENNCDIKFDVRSFPPVLRRILLEFVRMDKNKNN